MSLKYAILAVLSHSNRSGYDLIRKMDGSVVNFWPASHQQIYLELKKLNRGKLVNFEEKEQEGKPDKKIYSITAAGLKALKSWVAEPAEFTPSRDALLVKLMASHIVKPESIAEHLRSHRQKHQAKLKEYELIEKKYFSTKKLSAKLLAQYLALRKGILYEQSWLLWCEESLKRFTPSRYPRFSS